MGASSTSSALALCILGMHRSGTSALTRVLNLLGVSLGKHLIKPARANPTGFWENARIVDCHIDLLYAMDSYYDDILPLPDGWEKSPAAVTYRDRMQRVVAKEFVRRPLWGFKDPRTCRLLPMWNLLFDEINLRPCFTLIVRNPDEVAQSLRKRNGFSYNQSLMLSLGHMLDPERHTRGRLRVLLTYEQLMSDWRKQTARIGQALKIEWPKSPGSISGEVGSFLDPSLRHHRSGGVVTAEQAVARRGADPRVARWTFDTFNILSRASEGSELDHAALDAITDEFRAALPSLAAWRTQRALKEKFAKAHVWATRMDAEIKRLTQENEELRRQLAQTVTPG
jgi:hypothetical protein